MPHPGLCHNSVNQPGKGLRFLFMKTISAPQTTMELFASLFREAARVLVPPSTIKGRFQQPGLRTEAPCADCLGAYRLLVCHLRTTPVLAEKSVGEGFLPVDSGSLPVPA